MPGNTRRGRYGGGETAMACPRRAVPGMGWRLPGRREAAGARWRKVGPVTGTDGSAAAPGRNGPMRRMPDSFGTFAGQTGDPCAALRHCALLRDLAILRHCAQRRRRTVLRHRGLSWRRTVLRHRAAPVCDGSRIACHRREPRNERVTEARRPRDWAYGRLAGVATDQARE